MTPRERGLRTAPRQTDSARAAHALTPEQELAAAVIAQAVSDVRSVSTSRYRRACAARFLLSDGEGFRFWCAIAGLDRQLVRQRARRIIPPGIL